MPWKRRASQHSCRTNERTATDKDGDVAENENLIAGMLCPFHRQCGIRPINVFQDLYESDHSRRSSGLHCDQNRQSILHNRLVVQSVDGDQLSAFSFVTLRVYDLLGREVATLVDGERGAGSHTAVWDAASNPGGVYSRLVAGSVTQTRKMVLAR